MTSMRNALVAVLFLGSATAASADMVRHAGEWQTVIDGGQPLVACATHDQVFDKDTIARAMAHHPGTTCTATSLDHMGPVTKFAMECDVNGNHMVTSGIVTQTGPDSYTTKSHTHIDGGMMKLPGGRSFPMPDQDMTAVSSRTGPCKPGDRVMKN